MYTMLELTSKRKRGQSFVEMAAGLLVVIPVILLCIDLATLYMGASLNDNVCRDAARAASVGPPDGINPGEPQRRANGVVKKANQTAGAIRLDTNNIQVSENIIGKLPSAPYGGPVKGDVTVTTSVQVYPPFILSMIQGPGGITFTTSKTFSYTWAMASTATLTNPQAGNQAAQTF